MSIFDQIASKVSAGMAARVPSLGSITDGIGGALVGKFVPKGLQGTVNRALRGDISGAIADGLTGAAVGAVAKKLGKLQLLGGISLAEAERIVSEVQSTSYSKKNLWFLEIGEWKPESGYEDISHAFNLFATDVSYGPWTITSEAKPIGMGAMDIITGSERVDLRITTYDDARGTIRGWFDSKCSRIAATDGTVGVPGDYLVKIRITQSATNQIGGAMFGSFSDAYIMRCNSIDHELSRTEDGLQQIQMTFTEFDTFMYGGK